MTSKLACWERILGVARPNGRCDLLSRKTVKLIELFYNLPQHCSHGFISINHVWKQPYWHDVTNINARVYQITCIQAKWYSDTWIIWRASMHNTKLLRGQDDNNRIGGMYANSKPNENYIQNINQTIRTIYNVSNQTVNKSWFPWHGTPYHHLFAPVTRWKSSSEIEDAPLPEILEPVLICNW